MKQHVIVALAGVLSWSGVAVAQQAQDPVTERLRATADTVSRLELELVAVQTAAREAGPAREAEVQARFAAQEMRLAAMVKQVKEDLAEALALHAYAQKQMRLAKETLGRGLQLVDEAQAAQAAAEQLHAETARLAEAARQSEEASRQAAASAEDAAANEAAAAADRPQGPAVIYGGFNKHDCLVPKWPKDPWAQSRDKGPVRIVRSGVAAEFPSPLQGMPVQR